MRLVMAGLDYTTAGMPVREAFSPDAEKQRELLCGIKEGDVAGCVLIATCNRTELYLSFHGDVPPDGVRLLSDGLGLDHRSHRRYFVERSERQAVDHLMRVASGLLSSVPGDDQIASQVRMAVESARKAKTASPALEALFRSAVTVGKRVKTEVDSAGGRASVAIEGVREAERRLGPLTGKKALVIGNGTIGLLAAAELLRAGSEVSITLRDPRRRTDLPAGCTVVDFADRHQALAGRDLVVSATSSPRHTIEAGEIDRDRAVPGLFVDLAVPRDIDPEVARIPGVVLLNVDDLGMRAGADEALRIRRDKAEEIILEEAERFDLWRRNQRRHTLSGAGTPDFPIFVNLHGSVVLVAGGGKVAARRTEKLLAFGARVRVVSPEIIPEMAELSGKTNFQWLRAPYQSSHMDGVTLAIAATNSREVNAKVGQDARERGILVSVADKREECTFYFPAIVRSDFLAAGIVSNNGDHHMLKRSANRLRDEMESIDAEYRGETFHAIRDGNSISSAKKC